MEVLRNGPFGPLVDLLVTALAIMAAIIVIKLAASYLPSNGFFGAAKGLINVV